MSLAEQTQPLPRAGDAPSGRVHLRFLDGLRGLAALYVVLYHVGARADLPPAAGLSLRWIGYGHVAVTVFIVLSGYCLMLPVARSRDVALAGGLRGFAVRRAKRILPPYYAALILACLFIVATQAKKHLAGDAAGAGLATLSAANLASHGLLLHNLWPQYSQTIDPPMWSVATEWQIYFVFALLLLPVWRRWGIVASLAAAFVLGLAPHLLLRPTANLDAAYPWFLALFAFGMAAADLTFGPPHPLRTRLRKAPWGALAAALAAIYACTGTPSWAAGNAETLGQDLLCGVAAAALILSLTGMSQRAQTGARRPLILRAAESRLACWLGAISYSLYLVHILAWWGLRPFLQALRLSPLADTAVRQWILVPTIVLLTYLFHLLFERPFLRARERTPA